MIFSIERYESPGVEPSSENASSASRTKSASRSGSAYTATLPIPASLQARMTRTAISPRLAIRTFCRGLIPAAVSGTRAPYRSAFGRRRGSGDGVAGGHGTRGDADGDRGAAVALLRRGDHERLARTDDSGVHVDAVAVLAAHADAEPARRVGRLLVAAVGAHH